VKSFSADGSLRARVGRRQDNVINIEDKPKACFFVDLLLKYYDTEFKEVYIMTIEKEKIMYATLIRLKTGLKKKKFFETSDDAAEKHWKTIIEGIKEPFLAILFRVDEKKKGLYPIISARGVPDHAPLTSNN
jgi:hypothetical protein